MRISDWSSDVCSSDLLSLKSILRRLSLRTGLRVQQPVGPEAAIAEMHRQQPLAPVIEMAVRLERIADTAMHLQILTRRHLEAFDPRKPGRRRRRGEIGRANV